MIVRSRPHPLQLLFILRGSIVPHIAPKVLTIMALSCLVVWLGRVHAIDLGLPSAAPFSVLGLALSIFLGFRNNACYDRWWEARKHWGDLVVQARCLGRECGALLSDNVSRARLAHASIAFAHALKARLRDQDAAAAASPWLPKGMEVAGQRNVPDAILRAMNRELVHCLRDGALSDIPYQNLVQRLHAMTAIQTACERIRTTPTPFAYSLLLHRTAWLFCLLLPFGLAGATGLLTPLIVTIIAYTFFGLDALGDELEEPFGLLENDLPLNALVRVIEIDLLEGLGVSELPEPIQPVNYILH